MTFPARPAALALMFGEVVELKRVASGQAGGRSLADLGFRRAWAALLSGADPEDVARAEVAFAAAHIALGPVDAAALAQAGVSADDRRTIYRRAAARWLGALEPALVASLDRVAAGLAPPGPLPPFVERMASTRRAAADAQADAETVAEHSWSAAVLAGLVQRARGEPMGDAVLLGLAHHSDAVTLPDPLAAHLRPLLARRDDVADPHVAAFHIGNLVDRVLQQRHYANGAGLSLSDAMEPRALIRPGPLAPFHAAVLTTFGLAY